MDIQMPVMNGRDATAALREAGVNTPVIALTANVMAEDIADYRLAGCNDHLAKPIDKQRFFEVLSRYLDARSEHDDPANEDTQRFTGSVLVAEDNEDNSRLVDRMLQGLGLDVITVPNGEDAVRTALSDSVQLVLMDRHMPGLDGVEATRLLRKTGFRRPIVAFTAGDPSESEALLSAGCDGVLNKPIDRGHLLVMLRRYLADKAGDTVQADDGMVDEDMAHLVEQFLDGLGARKEVMNTSVPDRNREALKVEAHQIRGMAGAMGYPEMTRQAGKLETSLKSQSPDWTQVFAELEPLNDMIDRALQGREAKPG
jgi:CheY-like chemotaxis protein